MPVELTKPSVEHVLMATQCLYPGETELSTFQEPDYIVVFGEDEKYYHGRWITGIGTYGVKFPKSTTRVMNEAERERYLRVKLMM